jgi:hypothetical protein
MVAADALVLDVTGSVILSAAGSGTVKLSPGSSRVTWHPNNAQVNVSSNTNEPTAVLSLNGTTKLASTYTGSNDSTSLDCLVRNGFIQCTWTGGDAGARATLSLTGTQTVG